MPVIEILLFTLTAGFAAIPIATVVMMTGTRRDERHQTPARGLSLSAPALMTRLVLETYIRRLPDREDGE